MASWSQTSYLVVGARIHTQIDGWEEIDAVELLGIALDDSRPDGFGDACDVCPLAYDPDQAETDGDGRGDACDRAPADPTAWAVPGEATGLVFPEGTDKAALAWQAPAAPGGTVVLYDVFRSTVASDFSAPSCAARDITATTAGDAETPVIAAGFHYLVRSRNVCGGNLGNRSDGTERTGGACP